MAVDQYAIISLADLKATLGITVSDNDTQLEQAIDAATYQVESYLRRKVVQRRVIEWTTAGGEGAVLLRWAPIGHVHYLGSGRLAALTISSTVSTDVLATVTMRENEFCLTRVDADGNETVSHRNHNQVPTSQLLVAWINQQTGFSATLASNCLVKYMHRFAGRDLLNATATLTYPDQAQLDTRADIDRGIVYLTGGGFPDDGYRWPSAKQTIVADYDAGYEEVPPDIEQATRMLAAGIYYGRARDYSLASESLGDYSYSLEGRAQADREAFQLLAPYRRLR